MTWARAISYLAIAVLALSTGWLVRGWHEDSVQLAVQQAADKIRDDAISRESSISDRVEKKLAGLRANQTVIDRGVVREIEKPIYRNVCLGDDGIRLLNDLAAGLPANPAKPAAKVP